MITLGMHRPGEIWSEDGYRLRRVADVAIDGRRYLVDQYLEGRSAGGYGAGFYGEDDGDYLGTFRSAAEALEAVAEEIRRYREASR